MNGRAPLEELILRARQRSVWNLILAQAALAAAVATGGVVLLLLLGTELLNWPWLIFLFAGSFIWALHRAFKRLPSAYLVAQQVDHRLNLDDTLSTAWFFREDGRLRRVSPAVVEAQQRRAESLCGQISLRRAAPFAAPRTLRATALLGLVAFGLFALRCGLTRSLDLRPPIARAVLDVLTGRAAERAAFAEHPAQKRLPEPAGANGLSIDGENTETDSLPGFHLDPAESQDGKNGQAVAYQSGNRSGERPNALQQEARGEPDGSRGDLESEGDLSSSRSSTADADRAGLPPGKPPRSENSSLMDKLRDAMADLLSRLKIQPNAGDSTQTAAEARGGREPGGEQGPPGRDRQSADNAGGAEQQADQEGDGSERAQSDGGKSGEKSSSMRPSREERSGIGKEDGSKELREAEQLAAMGKISEILGKRAEDVSGEVTVEVVSGKQQLKTPYSQRNASHSEAGGNIHRDEVPLIFQHYVQQYFEHVRKAPLPAAMDVDKGTAAGRTP